jgi:hypothetical protein
MVEATSPCACGCIYIVGKKRNLDITSGTSCPTLPISWKIQVLFLFSLSLFLFGSYGHFYFLQASSKKLVDFRLRSVDFSCANSILNVRKNDGGESNDEEMVYQTETDTVNEASNIINATTNSISLQFHAPRRSCRVNIRLIAYSKGNGQLSNLTETVAF